MRSLLLVLVLSLLGVLRSEAADFSIIDEATSNSSPTTTENNDAKATGTNFQFGKPFRFTNIIYMGGYCNDPDEWYSKWVSAGIETLPQGTRMTHILCAEKPLEAYTREWNLQKLQEVEELVGDTLNETLVITVAVGLENDWSPVADLLRRGMAFFHAKEDPSNFDLTEYGLKPEEVLYFYFQWDEPASAKRIGKEVCRLKGRGSELKVGTINIAGRNGGLNYRTEIALQSFKEACPDMEVIELWKMEGAVGNQQSLDQYKMKLQFYQRPDVIFAGSDAHAQDILKVAEELYTPAQYDLFSATGWDRTHPHLLKSHKVLATVDQLVHYPNEGLWKTINTVVNIMQDSGLNSTKAAQEALGLDQSSTILADTLTISTDSVGYLLRNLLEGYDPGTPPEQNLQVSTGLFDVSITEMIPFEGVFETVLWTRLSWRDQRLAWNPSVYQGKMSLDPSTIWIPELNFRNQFESTPLFQSPVTIRHDGQAVMTANFLARFLCSTTDSLVAYPFESYDCSIDLGSPRGIRLDQSLGFDVIESDPHFELDLSERLGFLVEGTSTTVDAATYFNMTEEERTEQGDELLSIAYYELHFTRRPFTAYMRMIIPAFVINIIGFISFWIPDIAESVALGITALLCSLAFRDTVEMPDTAGITWSEVFMMTNVIYQASVMFIIWCNYGGKTVARYLDAFFRRISPKRAAEAVKQNATEVATELGRIITRSSCEDEISDSSDKDHLEEGFRSPPGTHGIERRGRKGGQQDHDMMEMNADINSRNHDTLQEDDDKEKVVDDDDLVNVDWIGQYLIAPSYVFVMTTLIFHGWFFF